MDMCGVRVLVEADDSGELLCSLPIEPDSQVQQDNKDCVFTGQDQVSNISAVKHFKARFSSTQAADEFKINFLEVRY